MKLPFMSSVRSAAQKLINKGATAAVQKAMQSMIELQQKQQQQRTASPQPGTPGTMHDINPPPDYVAPGSASSKARSAPQADTARVTPEPAATTSAKAATNTAANAAADAPFQSAQSAMPNPATDPTGYAQDMLNRMGIKIDIQANIDRAIDMGSLQHPSPSAPLPEGAKFISGSYANHAGSRNYKLYVPSTYTGQAMPLLVMLHGCTQNPDDFAAGTQMNQVAEEMGCFVAYPEQTAGANHSKCWNWFNAIDQQHGQGEPSIIAGIAQQIIDEYPVNERQVYVAGLSAGGAMAVIVGTLYPELFAAVGVHSGLPFASAQDLPSALSAMKRGASNAHKAGNGSQPIIVFHGDSDTTVNPRNGEQVMEQRLHSHKGAPSIQSGSVPNGYRYTQTTHTKADGSPLGEHWVVHGAGHAWSGGSSHGTYTDAKGPDASREMLRFFRTVS